MSVRLPRWVAEATCLFGTQTQLHWSEMHGKSKREMPSKRKPKLPANQPVALTTPREAGGCTDRMPTTSASPAPRAS